MPLNRMKGEGLPDIPGLAADPEAVLGEMLAQYEKAYFEQTGAVVSLSSGSPIRIWLYTIALQQYLLENLVKYYASQNYLAYGVGESLDHISATRGGPKRAAAAPAVVTMRFFFSVVLKQVLSIPAGTRVTPNGSIYFSLNTPCIVPEGTSTWEHVFLCQTDGELGNNFLPGQISTLVDPLPFVQEVVNIDTSQGGTDIQGDDQYAELIYISPEGYAVAGPELAYEYLAKSFSTAIVDVRAYQSAPGEVTVVPLLQGGTLPEEAFLAELLKFMSAKDRRPLTDLVHTTAPTAVAYQIDFTWFLESSSGNQQEVQERIAAAVDDYILWQKTRMGRDVNPQELIRRILEAGAKRLEIVFPAYIKVESHSIALSGFPIIRFGGIEDA